MALLNNQFYICKFYKRIPNETEPDNVPIIFKAELVSDKERTYSQRLQGLFSSNSRIVLRTDSSLIHEWNNGEELRGFVEFQGDLYQVQSIAYDYSVVNSLGAGRFSKKHTQQNAIKVLSLI